MNLIIVESPTKEKTITKFLDEKEYIVESSYGHIRDLPINSLGIDEKNNFKPYYVIIPRAKKIISKLKKIVQKVKNIYLATDYDREGEAIAWHITKVLGLNEKDVKRITFHEITKPAILEALKNPRSIDINLVNSQQARRVIDRLVGYKISPLLWKKIANKLSAGRVQSAALKFIYDRESEIEKFVPQEYWTIECEFVKQENETNIIKSRLKFINNKKIDKLDIKTQQEAIKIVEEIRKNKVGKIFEIKIEEKSKPPLEPFITSTLQQEASKKLYFSPSKTMSVAQSLYEGVDLGNNERAGLITYMRTDSTYVSSYAIDELRKFLSEKYPQYLNEQIRKFKTKVKNAQEAHEAIRPTSVYRIPEEIKQYLSDDQYKLYKLIWQRFVATQMKDMKYQSINIKIAVEEEKYIFESETKNIIFDGYTVIYPEEQQNEETNNFFIDLKLNDILKIQNCYEKQHFTEPPPRYTEASLIKELEKNGIGRPSTYATIVDTLKQRGYVTLKSRKFYITPLGKQVTELLIKFFPEIIDKTYTAKIEKLLDKISQGKENWTKVVSMCYEPLSRELAVAFREIQPKNEIVEGQKCKLCGSNMIIRNSKYGKFLSCEKFPKCKYKINYEENKSETKNTTRKSF
ncbi:MAG: type I DNA topoisomerase [Endomicrobiia bacterium]